MVLTMLILGCQKNQAVLIEASVSLPHHPIDILGYFRSHKIDGKDQMCLPIDGFFVLDQELNRYVLECEACPGFHK